MEPSEEMVSTRNRAGWSAASMAARTSATRLVTPVDVSLCTMQTARISCRVSARSRCSTSAGSTPCRQSPGTKSTTRPNALAIPCQSVAKCPVSKHSTRSPGLSVFTSAASHAPVPVAGNISTGWLVPKTGLTFSSSRRPSAWNSGPRWSMVGSEIARSTCSGTLVGPGICKK
jgi:hypothetical protein